MNHLRNSLHQSLAIMQAAVVQANASSDRLELHVAHLEQRYDAQREALCVPGLSKACAQAIADQLVVTRQLWVSEADKYEALQADIRRTQEAMKLISETLELEKFEKQDAVI